MDLCLISDLIKNLKEEYSKTKKSNNSKSINSFIVNSRTSLALATLKIHNPGENADGNISFLANFLGSVIKSEYDKVTTQGDDGYL